MSRLANATAWVFAATLFLVATVTTNLTGFGIGAYPLTYDDVALPRFAVALVGAVLVWLALAFMIARGNTFSWDVTWVALGLLGAWAVASAIASRSVVSWLGQSERLEGAATVILYAIVYGAGLQIGRSRRFVRRMSAAFALGAVVLSIQGLLQVAKLDRTNYTVSGYSFYLGSAFASLGNPNFLGGVLVIALPIAIALGLATETRGVRAAWWAASALILVALYYTYSQGAWLAALVEVALAAGILMWRRARARGDDGGSNRRALRVTLLMLLIVVVGTAAIVGVTNLATSRGLRLWGANLKETSSGRVLLLQTTVAATMARPVFGFGPDNFLSAFRLYRPDRFVDVFGKVNTSNNAHSWPLEYAATLGIPGALLLCVVLVLALLGGRPRIDDAAETGPASALGIAIWIGAVGYVVQMMFNVAVLASTIPFWVLLGALAAPHARRLHLGRTVGYAVTAVCGVLCAAALVAAGTLLTADAAYISSRLAYNGNTPGDSLALAEKASHLNPLSVKYSRAIGQSLAAQASFVMAQPGARNDEVRAVYSQAKAAFDRTLAKEPDDYATLAWTAALQAKTGTYLRDAQLIAESKRTAEKAAGLDRTHWAVAPLLAGDTSASAIRLAFSAAGLP